jgi:hypothetical protein
MNWIAQLAPPNPPTFWNAPPGSAEVFIKIGIAFIFGVALIFGLMAAPVRLRRPIIAFVTFISGLFWVLYYVWPQPIDRQPNELPVGPMEGMGFWLGDALPIVTNFTNILSGFLLGLGIYSLARVHGRRLAKLQRDWGFSVVLFASMLVMVVFGYWDWNTRLGDAGAELDNPINWGLANYGRDFLFEGLLQQMDAAMFSVIAFYILSAAYRAFRVRSIEATILLGTALIVMLSLMGAVEYLWNQQVINTLTGGNPNHFLQNFSLTEVATWLRNTFQVPSIRGIDFGVGIGALAMGLRLWLSLERTGGGS